MKSNPVRWFEIYASDLKRAQRFYETVFQVSLQYIKMDDSEVMMFPMDMNAPGAGGAICKADGFEPSPKGAVVYFGSEDCGVEEKRIEAAGGKLKIPKTSIGEYGFMCLFTDTEGNTVGVHSDR